MEYSDGVRKGLPLHTRIFIGLTTGAVLGLAGNLLWDGVPNVTGDLLTSILVARSEGFVGESRATHAGLGEPATDSSPVSLEAASRA